MIYVITEASENMIRMQDKNKIRSCINIKMKSVFSKYKKTLEKVPKYTIDEHGDNFIAKFNFSCNTKDSNIRLTITKFLEELTFAICEILDDKKPSAHYICNYTTERPLVIQFEKDD